jgi:hypothetical protein
MIDSSVRRLQRFARAYPLLAGPTARARARAFSVTGHTAQARDALTRAITILEASPNPLLLLDAYRDGAALLPDRRGELEAKAAHLAAALGIHSPPTPTDSPRPCA